MGESTIGGDAYIGFDGVTNSGGFPGNTLTEASNEANMEGLVEEAGNPSLNNYGGGDDDYDAGNISTCLSATAVEWLAWPTNSMDSPWALWVATPRSTTLKL